MIVEFRHEIPQQLRSMMTLVLVDRIVEIDGNRYRIDGYDKTTRELRARRALPNNQLVPHTASEKIFFPDIRHLVICE